MTDPHTTPQQPQGATPVPYQPPPPAARPLASEQVVVAAPMSFAGSAGRLWKLTRLGAHPAWKTLTIPTAITLIALAWAVILCWYVIFSVFLVPYRLMRRGSRKRKREALQHREMLAALDRQRQ